jgi:GNAT superfamily N-acetyltransferase
MMMAIRLAQLDDLSAFELDAERDSYLRREITARQCWVAARAGRLAGYVTLVYTFFGNGFVELLFVPPAHRRAGVGLALMRQCESVCRTPRLFTSTNLSNLPMQALLNKLDYTLTGTIHNLDEGDPELVYFKQVQP